MKREKNEKNSLFIFDISDRNIRFIEVKKRRNSPEILNFADCPLKKGIVENGRVLDEKKAAKAVAGLFLKEGISAYQGKKAVLVLSSGQVFYQVFNIILNNEDNLNFLIKENFIKNTPLKDGEFGFVHKVLEKDGGGKAPKGFGKAYRVLSLGYKKETVNKWRELFSALGLKTAAIDFDGYDIFTGAGLKNKHKSLCVIDIGRTGGQAFFFHGNELLYSYKIFRGWDHFAGLLAEETGIDLKEAEKSLKENGLEGHWEKNNILEILKEELDRFLSDLERNILYFEDRFKSKINNIYYYGGFSEIKGFLKYLDKSGKNRKHRLAYTEDGFKEDNSFLLAWGAAKREFFSGQEGAGMIKIKLSDKESGNDKPVNGLLKILESKKIIELATAAAIFIMIFSSLAWFLLRSDSRTEEAPPVSGKSSSTPLESHGKSSDKEEAADKVFVRVKDIGASLNIRSGPQKAYSIIGKAEPLEALELVEDAEFWAKIIKDGREGWVSRQFVDYLAEKPEE